MPRNVQRRQSQQHNQNNTNSRNSTFIKIISVLKKPIVALAMAIGIITGIISIYLFIGKCKTPDIVVDYANTGNPSICMKNQGVTAESVDVILELQENVSITSNEITGDLNFIDNIEVRENKVKFSLKYFNENDILLLIIEKNTYLKKITLRYFGKTVEIPCKKGIYCIPN